MITELLQTRESERKCNQSVAGKVGKALTKFYPLIDFSLRLVQGASDVLAFFLGNQLRLDHFLCTGEECGEWFGCVIASDIYSLTLLTL